jgi:hypothetical protein
MGASPVRSGMAAFPLALVAITLAHGAVRAQPTEPKSGPIPEAGFAIGDRLNLKPGLDLEAAEYLQGNSWFGQSQANIGAKSGAWTEVVAIPSLDWRYAWPKGSTLYGRTSVIGAFTNGIDAEGRNVNAPRIVGAELEDGYLGWKSGDLLEGSLGEDALDLSVGRRKYQVGSGFLFWKESNNGASRAAAGIAPRKAARLAATAKLSSHGWALDSVYLEFNDKPPTHTRLTGADLSYTSPVWGVVGVGGYQVLESDRTTRSGMSVFDLRADTRPIPQLRGLRLAGEYVHEETPGKLSTDAGFVGAGYSFDTLPWKPFFGYRRAIFRGDNPATRRSEAYDPFSLGISNWGSPLVGKYVLSNSNQRADAVRVMVTPIPVLDLTLEAYKLDLDQPGVAGRHYANEVDLMTRWAATRRLTFNMTAAFASPGSAARAQTGGAKDWTYLVLDLVWTL